MQNKSWQRSLVLIGLLAIVFVMCAMPAFAQQKPTQPMDNKALTEKVTALEKENLILREDLGKARLDARASLEAATAKLEAELADTNAKLEEERKSQAKKTRTLWLAIGVLAIGIAASN